MERGGREEVVSVTNIQNEVHAKHPQNYPRDARTAYHMGPEHVPILIDEGLGRLKLLAFYHSHPDHESYFSPEDRAQALWGGDEPGYPEAGQIVVSVRNRDVRATKVFLWNVAARDYVEAELRICAAP